MPSRGSTRECARDGNQVTREAGVYDLADDVLVGEPHNQTALGRRVSTCDPASRERDVRLVLRLGYEALAARATRAHCSQAAAVTCRHGRPEDGDGDGECWR
jgi:hypothetical protein